MKDDEQKVGPGVRRLMKKKLAVRFGPRPEHDEFCDILQEVVGDRANTCGVSLREFFDNESFEWKAQSIEEKIRILNRLKQRGLLLRAMNSSRSLTAIRYVGRRPCLMNVRGPSLSAIHRANVA